MRCRLPTSSRWTAAGHRSDSRAGVADSTPPGVVDAASGGRVGRDSRWGPAASVHAVSANAISSVGTVGLISGCYCCGSERGLEHGAGHDVAYGGLLRGHHNRESKAAGVAMLQAQTAWSSSHDVSRVETLRKVAHGQLVDDPSMTAAGSVTWCEFPEQAPCSPLSVSAHADGRALTSFLVDGCISPAASSENEGGSPGGHTLKPYGSEGS